GPALRRRFGLSAPALPTAMDVTNALAETIYDVPPYSLASPSGFRNRMEGWISGPQLHNLVHVWVGGSMGPMSSPNDPVFFLHHCFIDKLWADWQRLHPGATYLPVTGGPAGHNLGDAMQPWLGRGETVTPASVLDHHALGYAYDTEPECQATQKFRDDIPTLKFRENIVTPKVQDDLGGGTVKAIDDVKQPFLDGPGGGGKFLTDPIGVGPDPGIARAAPFVLATPHHSMAWAQAQPAALQAALAQSASQIAQFAAALAERDEAERQGQLTEAERAELEQLREEHQAMLAEHQQLAQSVG